MSSFDADYGARMALSLLGRGLRIHVFHVLLDLATTHSMPHDVKKCKHTGFGAIDYAIFEIGEVGPSGTPCIGDSRYSATESEAVRIDAKITRISAPLPGSGISMDVNIDETWRNVKAFCIDHPQGFGCRYLRCHFSDPMVLDCNIPDGAYAVLGIDHMATFNEQVILCLPQRSDGHR